MFQKQSYRQLKIVLHEQIPYVVDMKILLTGATGYIGRRLLPLLVEKGHEVVCLVRDPTRLKYILPIHLKKITIISCDLKVGYPSLPLDIEGAYYLIHSMSDNKKDLSVSERIAANNFLKSLENTSAKQIIYLSGLISTKRLSSHLQSRLAVEKVLASSSIPLTTLRAGIIIGSASASFEIIRDLTEKLSFVPAPRDITSLCQPIAIDDTLFYLMQVLGREKFYNKSFDIGGPDVLSYEKMIKIYAEVRGLKRYVLKVPFLSAKLLPYFLYFLTSTNFLLSRALLESLKSNAVCLNNCISKEIAHQCITYKESIKKALSPIAQTSFFSTLEEARALSKEKSYLLKLLKIPIKGCYKLSLSKKNLLEDLQKKTSTNSKWTLLKNSPEHVILYKNNGREYWIEYNLTKGNKKLWHRPRGISQRIFWFLNSFWMKKNV